MQQFNRESVTDRPADRQTGHLLNILLLFLFKKYSNIGQQSQEINKTTINKAYVSHTQASDESSRRHKGGGVAMSQLSTKFMHIAYVTRRSSRYRRR